MRIAVVIGTRAQMVKMAPVMRAMQDIGIDYWFLHTGQHRETFDDLRQDFGVKPPDAEAVSTTADVKTLFGFGSWSFRIAVALLFSRRRILPICHGVVLVHGDTASTVWGALLGRMTGNAVVHVESGLRSFHLMHPFPEELFRLVTFKLATAYACPDSKAVANLSSYKGEKLNMMGNTLYDSFLLAQGTRLTAEPLIQAEKFGLVSIHRFETIYRRRRLKSLVDCIMTVAKRYMVLLVAHPPLIHRLSQTGLLQVLEQSSRIKIIPRMSYFPFVALLKQSTFVITDGGSNQEELAYLGKPTLILRKASERYEGLGKNALLGSISPSTVINFLNRLDCYRRKPLAYTHSPTQRLIDWINRTYTVRR